MVDTPSDRQTARMRKHREELQLALSEGWSLEQARRVIAHRRWEEADRLFRERMGREIEPHAHSRPDAPAPQPQYWWLDR